MDIPTMVALLTLLGSCCLGLTLLAILIVVVALLLSGRLKSAKVTGLGAGVELTAADKPPAARPAEPPAATPAPPPPAPAEKQPVGVSFGEGNDFTGATIQGVAGRDLVEQAVSLLHDPED